MKALNLILVASFVTPALAAETTPAVGANSVPQQVILQTPMQLQPGADGKLQYTTASLTGMLDTTTNQWFAQRQDDLKFLEKSVKDIVDQYNHIYADIYVGKLMKMSNDTSTNAVNAIPIDKFFDLKREYLAAREVYKNRIAGLKAITQGGLPSANVALTQGQALNLPAYRSLNLDAIVSEFTGHLNELDALINQTVTKVVDVNNIQGAVNGFNIDTSKLTILTEAARDKARADIFQKRQLISALTDNQDKMTYFMVHFDKDYITDFGSNQRFRPENQDDKASAQQRYDKAYEIKWARSYLRKKWGIGQGTIHLNYKKQWFKIEELMLKPEDFVDFHEKELESGNKYIGIRDENKLSRIQENIRNMARSADHRALADGSWNPIVIAQGLWTTLTGRLAQMETVSMILKLMTADVNEEALVVSAGGRDKMIDAYKATYEATPELAERTRKLECAYDPQFTEAAIRRTNPSFSCGVSTAGQQAQGNNTRTFFQKVDQTSRDQFQNFQIANKLEAQLKAQEEAGTGAASVDDQLLEGYK